MRAVGARWAGCVSSPGAPGRRGTRGRAGPWAGGQSGGSPTGAASQCSGSPSPGLFHTLKEEWTRPGTCIPSWPIGNLFLWLPINFFLLSYCLSKLEWKNTGTYFIFFTKDRSKKDQCLQQNDFRASAFKKQAIHSKNSFCLYVFDNFSLLSPFLCPRANGSNYCEFTYVV